MNDALRPPVLWGALAVAGALAGLAPTAALRVAVLGLGALALVPLLGWLRIVSFTPVAAAGAGAVVAAWLLGKGQAVPVALLAASVAAAGVGAAVTAVWPRRPPAAPAFVSVVAALAVWGLLLPRVVIRPSAQPVLFGIDLGTPRSLAMLAVGLLAIAALGLVNVGRSAAGREIAAVGVAAEIALRSGADPAAVRVRAGLLAGLFAGWAAVLLVLDAGALPAPLQLSPAAAVVWLGVAALGGIASIGGVVVAAVMIGGLAALVGAPEAALAGLALAAVAVAGGRGIADLARPAGAGAEPGR
jgi:branched-chain amino acid transport system permease protein